MTAPSTAPRRQPLYCMDTAWLGLPLGGYALEARVEMTAAAGYDLAYFTLWPGTDEQQAEAERFVDVATAAGLGVAGGFALLEVDGDAAATDAGMLRFLDCLAAADGAVLEVSPLAASTGARAGGDRDGEIRDRLAKLAVEAATRGVGLALYPHTGLYAETVEECLPLLSDDVGLVFCTSHWIQTAVRCGGDVGDDLRSTLAAGAGRFVRANVNGTSFMRGQTPTLDPLGDGDLDGFRLLGAIRAAGYDGPIGIQGVGLAGDPFVRVSRSVRAYDDICARLDAHADRLHLPETRLRWGT